MTERQIKNFLKKHGHRSNFHLFVDYEGCDPKSVYRWFEAYRTFDEVFKLWADDEVIISVQFIGNNFFIKHEA